MKISKLKVVVDVARGRGIMYSALLTSHYSDRDSIRQTPDDDLIKTTVKRLNWVGKWVTKCGGPVGLMTKLFVRVWMGIYLETSLKKLYVWVLTSTSRYHIHGYIKLINSWSYVGCHIHGYIKLITSWSYVLHVLLRVTDKNKNEDWIIDMNDQRGIKSNQRIYIVINMKRSSVVKVENNRGSKFCHNYDKS